MAYRSAYHTTWSRRTPTETPKASSTSVSTPLYTGRYSSGGSGYSTGRSSYSRPSTETKDEPIKKSTSTAPPPVSYRGLTVGSTGARSRDPSPVSGDAALGSRLRTYARSTSREPPDTPSAIDRIASKYGGRTSITKQSTNTVEPAAKTPAPKEESKTPRYSGRTSTERTSSINSYTSRQLSREDLSVKTYINSRFLPKNTVERSTTATAYSGLRCASAIEERRKRDSLLLTQAQLNRKRESSPTQRQSSLIERTSVIKKSVSPPPPPIRETETISVVTRGTSPGPPKTGPRRTELVAREVRKDITRSKIRPPMTDKQIQSDRLDDPTRYSRFAHSSPWSNSTSLSNSSTSLSRHPPTTSIETDSSKSKLSTPLSKSSSNLEAESLKSKLSAPKSTSEKSSKLPSASLSSSKKISPVTSLETTTSSSPVKNGVHRSSSSRSVSSSDSLPGNKSKTGSSSNLPKASSATNATGQQLPPLPKSSSSSKASEFPQGLSVANKDFRKSVLNMNGGEGTRRRRVESASTASEDEDRTSAAVEELPSATESGDKETKSRSFLVRALQPFASRLSCVTRVESGERAWWLRDDAEVPEGVKKLDPEDQQDEEDDSLRHIDSELEDDNEPLGDRASPEGLEADQTTSVSGRRSPYDNVPTSRSRSSKEDMFICRHTNIDDVLGGSAGQQPMSPLLDKIMTFCNGVQEEPPQPLPPKKLDDAALQMYKDGDYGAYLDLEASINEQHEEFEGFHANKKNSLVLRTQLSVRVHAIIERLSTSEGRELRRALFSLKQVFQEDKDLVHEFVRRDGLGCLVRVGQQQHDDQNHQSYILRALGQLMLYVDGMNGVMEHPPTVQWLYSLVASRYRLVVKTALKLLLVFVEYTEANCARACRAVNAVDREKRGLPPWRNVMRLLEPGSDGARSGDHELLILAATLVNRCLGGLPEQDQYYDQVDALEEQGMERVVRWYMSRPGTDLDLLHQLHVYEATLAHEDGVPMNETNDYPMTSPAAMPRLARQPSSADRKSRRHSTGARPSDPPQELPGELSPAPDHTQAGVTPALRRRRERAERQRSFIREQQESAAALAVLTQNGHGHERPHQLRLTLSPPPSTPLSPTADGCASPSVRDLTHRLAAGLISPTSPPPSSPSSGLTELNENSETSDMRGAVSRAKQGLAKSQSKADVTPQPIRSPTSERPATPPPPVEGELRWDEVKERAKGRPLKLCDLDFTDLNSEDELDVLAPAAFSDGVAPPPPPPPSSAAPPPPFVGRFKIAPPPPPSNIPPPPPPAPTKTKKTVKLFWREVRRDDQGVIPNSTVWDELDPVPIDTQKLEHLFESRAKDLITKKQQEMNKNKEIIVLDHKRSNAINIGMTKLPPARSIKTAILKMDATVVSREGIDKLLTMLPTEEEKIRIQEAQAAQPELPLGSAEQFLITLASISELQARLRLWAFKLDFESAERDIAEPLMDLKQGIETLRRSKTFRAVLATLRSVGAFLNGQPHVRGFHVDYLAKVPEVKDTVHKHSLLHHLCHIVMERFPEATDLYSELGAITRASRVDFEEIAADVRRLESDCAASWLHLRAIAKHDGTTLVKARMGDFLSECAERIVALGCVHRRVMNRYRSFLLWLGVGPARAQQRDLRPSELCRVISEFALEYRTTRERVLQQLEKKATHRERNKTRGKLITDLTRTGANTTNSISAADKADRELRQLLQRPAATAAGVTNPSAEDELLETLVRTATKAPSVHNRLQPQRERKRTRHADRKSLKRSRTRENNPYALGARDSP